MIYQPKTLQIQLTNKCNNVCTCCFYLQKQHKHEFTNHDMEDNLIENILNNISLLNELKYIVLSPLYGESFLHPKIFYFIDEIKKLILILVLQ